MKRREQIVWLIIGAALVIGFLALIPSHYDYCSVDEAKQEHCSSYQLVPFIFLKIARFLDAAGAAITALATIAIAGFTLTLKRATDKLWDAGERQLKLLSDTSSAQSRDMQASIKAAQDSANAANKQADAIIVAERPYIFIKITEPGVEVGDEGRISFAGKRLRVKFVNYGRTPALIDEVAERYTVVEGSTDVPAPLDPAIDRGRLVPIGTVSAENAPHVIATSLFNSLEGTGTVRMLEHGAWQARRMFFYGFVRYRDAFGTRYINGFLAIFAPLGQTWVLRGDEKYNYSRTERAEDIPPHPDYTV